MAKDIVDIAIGELGYAEQGENRTKYGAWMGMNGAAWCHMFVSWCAYQAGESAAVPKTASCANGISFFKNKGQFKYRGKYTPKRGDIIHFRNGGHVGIVEKVKGSTVHTVEGNSSDKVTRRSYSLSDTSITGYGVPTYKNLNGANSSTGGSTKKTSKEELAYLKRILKKKKPTVDLSVNGIVQETNELPDCNIEVLVNNGKNLFTIPVKDGMKIIWERKGTPGKLTFETKYDKDFKIVEGNSISVTVDGTKIFYGFIFTRQMSKDGIMSFTAYDQLRYLKNKETLIYKNKRADEVIKIIAERFNLNCGKLANTSYKMSAVEDDTTLFDIIQNALDNTLMVKNKVYVFYDKAGQLRLSNVADMKVNNCLIDEETGGNYTYKTTIDDDVYNQIKLVYENKDKGTYDLYISKSTKNINNWGVLQLLEKIDDPDVGKLKSQAYLKLYNQKQRNLKVSDVIGCTKVRAGSLVPVLLNLGDIKIANYMLVDKVTHTFSNRQHFMDLSLSGGDFSAE